MAIGRQGNGLSGATVRVENSPRDVADVIGQRGVADPFARLLEQFPPDLWR
jgi:hypothetical protein